MADHISKDLPPHDVSSSFPPMDPARRIAVEKTLKRKLDTRCSLFVLIYILNYLDRNNIASARLKGLQEDLALSDTQYATCLSILYVGYILMQVPSNMMINKIQRPSLYIACAMLLWGIVSTLSGNARNFGDMVAIRFFLGFVEAAFLPGALLILSKWYTRRELTTRNAILFCGNLISNAFSALVGAGVLSNMQGVLGHAAWRWLFWIEGAITCAVAIAAAFILPDLPQMSTSTRLSALPRLGLRGLRTKARAAPAAVPLATPEVEAHARKMRTIESMPFQTYQHALDVIRKDREEKLVLIKDEHEKIAKMIKYKNLTPTSRVVKSMTRYLEDLKIKADINNPRVKYNFDTGVIGMNKPVYRFLLEKKWRSMRRPVLMQRLTQMSVIPDVLPNVDPRVDVQVRFVGRDTAPGVFVGSKNSERPPTLKIIPFRQGEKLCTIAVVDPDVPDLEKDGFRYRCHWIVSNIPISPMQTQAIGTGAKPSDTLLPYLPPHVQKGSPYHRYALFVFEQPGNKRLDPALLAGKIDRETFNLRSFQEKHELKTVGAHMWRGRWDEDTKEVMQRNGLPGWDVMFTRVKDT